MATQIASLPGHARLTGWLSFVAWAAVGSAVIFGFLSMLSIGLFTLPPTLLIAVFLTFASRRGAFGLLAGAGAISLFVAWLNRFGPGTVVSRTSTSVSVTSYWDPRPWLAAGVILIVAGVGAHAWHSRKSG